MVILAMLLAAGLPSFSEWIQNTQVRTAAEVIQSGLQKARSEAVKRNANVSFRLTDATGLLAWSIACEVEQAGCTVIGNIESGAQGEVGAKARVGVSSTTTYGTPLVAGAGITALVPASAIFNNLGQLNPTSNFQRIDVTYAGVASARRLVILVSPGGKIRMCDPSYAVVDPPDPKAC